ncbi:hypothetical protein BC834DRAFT_885220 [Gloeopeniophorella convolvens]|nr:hypothetical protein BC834DRAFT_885220 [Gloeopeniophorella convolvens]
MTLPTSLEQPTRAVAVYCGSSFGTEAAFRHAANSLGRALAAQGRPLVYGGGSKGIMGVVSGAVLEHGGSVTGVVPSAMSRAGGESEQVVSENGVPVYVQLGEKGREKVESIVVGSMHERKVEMARRACGFVGLPGGYGTFEEIMEVITWTQLGIHSKPVVVVNVLGFFDSLRALIQQAVKSGFIKAQNEHLALFIDCPAGADPTTFDWGTAALSALDSWSPTGPGLYTWAQFSKSDDPLVLS